MNYDDDYQPGAPRDLGAVDRSQDVRVFAAWIGLVMVAMGVAMAGYLFFRIGQVLLDPRSFETQVDRWEFVVRGRTSDVFPAAFETPERRVVSGSRAGEGMDEFYEEPVERAAPAAPVDPVEDTLRLVGRLGSKSARAAALLMLVLVLLIMVKIVVSIIHAGIRLAALAAGERDYMKRIVDELVYQRQNPK